MIYEDPKWWEDLLSLVLWAYNTSKRALTQATSFSLFYRSKMMVLIEMVHSAHFALASELSDSHDRIYDINALEEKRQN